MPRHAANPGDPTRCTCGQLYPAECRGGLPILPSAIGAAITSQAAEGVPFTRIAEQVGVSLHTVRRVVHG